MAQNRSDIEIPSLGLPDRSYVERCMGGASHHPQRWVLCFCMNPSSIREKIINDSWEVHAILTDYIAIHNKLYGETGTFWSLIRNVFFGVRFDYEGIYGSTSSVFNQMIQKYQELESYKKSSYEIMSGKEKAYYDCLLEYSLALTKTFKAFLQLTFDLWHTSKSFKERRMTWTSFNKDSSGYRESIDDYKRIGSKLNSLYQNLNNEKL